MKTHSVHRYFIAALLMVASQARAACDGFDTETWSANSVAQARQCLTRLNLSLGQCDGALCKKVDEWRGQPPEARAPAAPALLEKIKTDARAKAAKSTDVAASGEKLALKMDALIAQLKDATPEMLGNPKLDPFRNAQSQGWRYEQVSATLAEGDTPAAPDKEIPLGPILDQACAAPLDQQRCDSATRASGALVLGALLYEKMVKWFVQEDRESFVTYVGDTKTRWTAYFDKSRMQFPWELGINSWRFERELARRRAREEPGGFGLSTPPDDQWIFLHPSVALRYGGGPDRRLDQAVVIELAGYYSWDWSGTSIKNLRGASLIATWANAGSEQRKGYGFMFHLPKNYSIGLVQERGGGQSKLGVIVSIDLGKVIQDPDAAKRKLLGL